jgi:FkbM family methyltransferase
MEIIRGTLSEQINELKKSNNVIVYGCGEAGDNFHTICKYYNIKVEAYVDTYFTGNFQGEKVWNIDELKKNKANTNCDIVICAGPAFEDIKQNIANIIPYSKIYDGGALFDEFISETFNAEPYISFYDKNRDKINEILDMLEDDYSRETFSSYQRYLQTKNVDDLEGYWSYDQYFPEGIYKERKGCFIDAGAYNGKTAREMCERNPALDRVICFEPVKSMLPLIKDKLEKWGIKSKVEVHNTALSSKNGVIKLSESGTGSSISDLGGIVVETEALDKIGLKNVSFIKMDIEGAEMEALKGARNTIIKNCPYLAICIYHRPEDILEIPMYIMSLGIDYKYYIRHHEKNGTELVFYAVHDL